MTENTGIQAAEGAVTRLAHTLQARHVMMISFGGIIGAGVFVGSSSAIAKAGPGTFLTYGTCGLLVFLIMRMLGEMAVANPGKGSFVEYSALGLGPWAGFVTGWLYWYFWVFTVGAETVAGAKLLQAFGLDLPLALIGCVLVVAMTAINLASVRTYGEVEFWFSLIKVGAIAAFIVICAGYIGLFHFHDALNNLTIHGGFLPKGVGGLVAALPIVIFSMMGSEVATIAAAESSDPVANVTRAARSVALRILLFYVASMAAIVMIIPWDTLVPGKSPFKPVLDLIGIPGSSLVMQIIIVTAVLSCLNSGLYITSRMLYELSAGGHAPASWGSTGGNQVPKMGILVGCAGGIVAALAQIYLREDVFTLLVGTSGDIILFVYLIVAFAQIRTRQRMEAQGVQLPLKMWLFPWLSYAVIAGIIAVLITLGFMEDQRETLFLSCLTAVVVGVALLLVKRGSTQTT